MDFAVRLMMYSSKWPEIRCETFFVTSSASASQNFTRTFALREFLKFFTGSLNLDGPACNANQGDSRKSIRTKREPLCSV